MKVTPQDITPTRVFAALQTLKDRDHDDMVASKPLSEAIKSSLAEEQNKVLFGEIGARVWEMQQSCYDDGFCFCQLMSCFAIGLRLGILVTESVADQVELEAL